ncbi:thermonuclease family protein [Rhodobium gokarnense]|uniref:Endonuclease YncB(Thermonuclease family) n=1 Tax=Rhodobium gokarnense TaxID=364296 RepID=A0ABT3HAE3_9HYPH|nr:thermonuclease family protein [Rhodobium gokarnense]MCW2307365.1 endonuclease YncB(thermonuclease family) [Rhodobium gokarnense]
MNVLARLAIAACAVAALTTSAVAYEFKGRGEVVDGDTLVIDQQSIRLSGIDAPEAGQRCQRPNGKTWRCDNAAMDRLQAMLAKGDVTCRGDEFDGYERLLAHCTTKDGIEINETLVREGLAWAFVKYSNAYVAQEQEARQARRGIWQADTQPAWAYRAAKWDVGEQKAPDGCPIKGNISRNGRIYHPPWSPWYSRTKISPEKGERWFCSEREALDAGWRAPRWR